MQVDRPDPETYLTQALTSPQLPQELRPFYEAFQRFHANRLWYQLTLTLESFLSLPTSAPFRIDLYRSFISSFAAKLDPLKHASIAVSVARTFENGSEAVEFLDGLLPGLTAPVAVSASEEKKKAEKKEGKDKEAEKDEAASTKPPPSPPASMPKTSDPDCRQPFVLLTMERAHFLLLLGQADETKEAMERCERILEGLDSVETVVNAAFYRVSGDYWKAKAEFADYYRNSLLYLACIDPSRDLSPSDRQSRAHDLGISALLGSIYNFGELLMHPILESLVGTEGEVVKKLLEVFNRGDIAGFERLVPEIGEKEPFLQQHFPFLREKICLLALIEAVFKRPTSDRTLLPFSVISREAQVPVDEVEHLVMKALALKLIRGTLDQVSSHVSISWVQPRVLDRTQIDGLRARLSEWTDKVAGVELGAREGAGELIVQ
ncbi:hypothetical protein JCM11251_007606 [Rhodosporidiobolus azoricus]